MKQTDRVKMSGMERPLPSDGGRDPTIPLRESHATEDDELVNNIQDRLNGIKGNEHDSIRTSKRNPAMEADDDDDLDLEDEELEEEEENKEVTDAQDDGLEISNDDSDEINNEEKEDKEEPSGLPDAYVRSAVAFGWGTKEDAINYYKEDPQRALSVFKSIYNARIQATNEFARLGQAARTNQQRSQKSGSTVKKLTPEQASKLRETLGEDAAPLLDIIESQQTILEELAPQFKTMPNIPKQEPAEVAQHGLVDQQISEFFSSDSMKPWQKVYGSLAFGQDWEDLTPTQQRFRHRVLEKANDIIGGAQLHGRPVTLPGALEEAHMVVTQQFRDEVIVSNLKKNAVKRHRAISVKPSKSKVRKSQTTSDFGTPGKRSREQAERAVASKMSKIFS